jgi:hypothetical protein
MRCKFTTVRSAALRARQIALLCVPMIMLAASLLLSPSTAYGGIEQNIGPIPAGDDQNSASVNPYPAIAVSTIASNPPGQCTWINTGLANFSAANPANGTGNSGQGWTFTWAGVAQEAQVEAGIGMTDYYPWVVNKPAAYVPNGATFSSASPAAGGLSQNPYPAANFNGEIGGAVFNLQYSPQPGAPTFTIDATHQLDWIQAYTGTLYGNAFGPILDNGGFAAGNAGGFPATPGGAAQPYGTQNSFSPFYDYAGAAGTWGAAANSGAWFLDRPQVPEFNNMTGMEYENNPIVSSQFQVVLAYDTKTVVAGVTQNNVTLYGGLWWGFNYTAQDRTNPGVPEPSTYVLLAFGGIGLFFFRRMSGRQRAS